MSRMRTEEFAQALASEMTPVRRLGSPGRRLAYWLFISIPYALLLILAMGARADIGVKVTEVRFMFEVGSAFLTSVLAAAAAFCAECPGRPLLERLAPLPALAVWLGCLGEGCWRSWIAFGADGLRIHPDLECIPGILLAGLVPGMVIFYMIRKGAPVAPVTTSALATLAAASLGAGLLRLLHIQDASIMLLTWQFGSVAILTALGALTGRRLLKWPRLGDTIWRVEAR